MSDLRRVGSHPDFWYPVLHGYKLKPGKVITTAFAGEPIAVARAADGSVFALEDRCAHRQVPLSDGVVCGSSLKCGYHGWEYAADGRCTSVPYLSGDRSRPHGVRAYPCREAYGLIFVFPGDPAKAASVPFPQIPASTDPLYKTRFLDRRIACHYSFMHENLMDMNHQFLHRSLMGSIRPTLLGSSRGADFMEARYTFARVGGSGSLGETLIIGEKKGQDEMVIRTQYPYQTLTFGRGDGKNALDLWLAYVPVDREQRVTASFGLMNIKRPGIPGIIHLFWPFIVWFTEGIFEQDQRVMESEQRAWDAQGEDRNNEVFPVIRQLREVLARNGRPISDSASAPPPAPASQEPTHGLPEVGGNASRGTLSPPPRRAVRRTRVPQVPPAAPDIGPS